MGEAEAADGPGWQIERLSTAEDLTAVLDVEGESFNNPWTRAMYESEMGDRKICHIYLARTPDCRVAGFCACRIVAGEVHLNNVAVRPAFRGQGIGTALLRGMLSETARLGADRATLEVRASNAGAQRFYERLGFRVSAIRPKYYTQPTEDALIMWREPA